MKKSLFLVSAITILQFGTFKVDAQQKTQPASLFSRIDNYLTAGTENGFSGAIAVIRNGEVIINKGYGLANKDTRVPNSPNTIFDIGSNTKQFTAAAILKLVELGKLSLDDPLSKYFSELPSEKTGITIHQLLTHSAGFSESIGRDFDEISQEEFFKQLFLSELLFEPGTMYSYSNTGYSILGRIIELASGLSYESFLSEYLFAPAGMKQTGYLLPKWEMRNMARGYNRNVLEMDPPITRYQEAGDLTWHLKANGGINATQNDMLLWYKALKTNVILSPESFKKISTPHVLAPSGRFSYGYGWGVKNSEANTLRLSHNGSNGTYSHSIIWYPEKDIFIVYATNANSSEVEYLGHEVEKLIQDESYTPEPIRNNVYSYTMEYIKQYTPDTSNNLIALLRENYPDEFSNSRLFNVMGNVLLRLDKELNWALELFKLNVQRYPEDGNLWDSLGEGYLANDLKEAAIESFEKAIELGYKDSQEKLAELKKE